MARPPSSSPYSPDATSHTPAFLQDAIEPQRCGVELQQLCWHWLALMALRGRAGQQLLSRALAHGLPTSVFPHFFFFIRRRFSAPIMPHGCKLLHSSVVPCLAPVIDMEHSGCEAGDEERAGHDALHLGHEALRAGACAPFAVKCLVLLQYTVECVRLIL